MIPAAHALPTPVTGRASSTLLETRQRVDVSSASWAFGICSIVLVSLLLKEPRLQHWFAVPVFAGGWLITIDAVDWFRGRVDVFDPVGLLGLLGFHLFFLAPLLHVYWEHYLLTVAPPADWRVWLGWMACFNFGGIVLYRFGRRLVVRRHVARPSVWRLQPARVRVWLPLALGLTFGAQVLVYAMFGGVSGYVEAFSDQSGAFQGMGWVFMISESFPILALIAFASLVHHRRIRRSWLLIVAALLVFVALRVVFGGLRGSRGNTVYALIWAVGIVHLWLRPIPRKVILSGLVFVVAFAYVYGFYKSFGWEGVTSIGNPQQRMVLEQRGNRSLRTVVLGDFGRSDVQAFLLYRFLHDQQGDQLVLAKGRTYVGAMALMVPGRIYPNRPATKVKEGTEALYGRYAYSNDGLRASYAYGLAGEAMLNVGPLGIAAAFFVLGLLTGWLRRLINNLDRDDSRLLVLPYLLTICLILPVWDSDIILFYLIKNGAVPLAAIFICSRVVRQDLPRLRSARS